MCIIFVITNSISSENGYKLILASNRDEYYARPTISAAPWTENTNIVGRRDMEPGREGGTWLAVSRIGNVIKLGALLNVSGGESKKENAGRGSIVSDYVKGDLSSFDYTNNLINSGVVYNGFNMVSVETSYTKSTLIHTSNSPAQNKILPENAAYGFGNSTLSNPLKKVIGGAEKFKQILANQTGSQIDLKNDLMTLLGCEEKFLPDDELKKRNPQWVDELCSIYVSMPKIGYGTRTKTVILVDHNDKIHFYEETMETQDPNGDWKQTYLTF